MKKDAQNKLLWSIIILSIIGLAVSGYLTENHFVAGESGSVCDFNEVISCSLVNTSEFSELFNVPVAVFGALWFVIMGLLAWKAMKKKGEELYIPILGWSILGILFVIYMIIAEIILQALCPFCTVVHIISVVVFVLAIILYKSSKNKLNKTRMKKLIQPWITLVIIVNLIPLVFFNLPSKEVQDYSNVTACITENGVNMYGSFRCAVCAKTRAMFGDAFENINEIECHPQGENPQTQLCLDKKISGTPTWILEPEGEEIKRFHGFMNVDELKEFSGCTEVN
jgi:uncharacterized membrane protein